MQVHLLNITGTDLEKATLAQAALLIQTTSATKRFAELLMASNLTETRGKTNAQVLQDLDNSSISTNVFMYSKWWSKVLGYTYLSSSTIYVNRKYFHGLVGVASNLFHECSHELGYAHNGVWATSVPYTLNRIFEQCCVELAPPPGLMG